MQRTAAAGYDSDFALWVAAQASALREGRLSDLDVPNVIEEIEALAKRDRRKMKKCLMQLEAHVLKVQYQPEKETVSWRVSINKQAAAIRAILDDSPSLRREMDAWILAIYPAAREQARLETHMLRSDFPAEPTPAFLALLGRTLKLRLGVFGGATAEPLGPDDLAHDDQPPED